MSQERAEALAKAHKETMKAFNAGDFDTAFADIAPDVEWRILPSLPDSGLLSGREAVVRYFMGLRDALNWRVESKEFIEVGNGRFLAHLHGTAVGKATELIFTIDFFHVLESGADGLVVRIREYENREEALAAAGLSEQDAHADS